jgi:tRNA-splicing ligase RtcB
MNQSALPPLASWLAEPLPRDVAKSIERLRRADDVRYIALMPDIHMAADVCVGAVVATRELVYPAAVGSDIGCGMASVAVQAAADLLDDPRAAAELLDGLSRAVPSNKHPEKRDLPDELVSPGLSGQSLAKAADRDGRVQLGTLGRGNHFLEFQADHAGRLWTMVHSGSRAMGQIISRHHLKNAVRRAPGPEHLRVDSDEGQAYLSDVAWARCYAASNRMAMLQAVDELLRQLFKVEIDWPSLIHSDHNHVREESHFGQMLWIHRKGAQSSRSGEAGMVPGSMGTSSFHVLGRGAEKSLHSCSHGAGRRLSRTEAARKVNVRDLSRQMGPVWFDHRRAAALRDEAPSAYKDIRKIMRAQRELVRVTRELSPLLSYKGL